MHSDINISAVLDKLNGAGWLLLSAEERNALLWLCKEMQS